MITAAVSYNYICMYMYTMYTLKPVPGSQQVHLQYENWPTTKTWSVATQRVSHMGNLSELQPYGMYVVCVVWLLYHCVHKLVLAQSTHTTNNGDLG